MGYGYGRDDDDSCESSYVDSRARQIAGHDGGVCNPRKAKEYGEAEDRARQEYRDGNR